MLLKKYLPFFILLLVNYSLIASEVKISTPSENITIGTKFKILYNYSYPKNAIIDTTKLVPEKNGIFELSENKIISTEVKDSIIFEKKEATYIAFPDSVGSYTFKPILLNYVNNGNSFSFNSDSLLLQVNSYMANVKISYIDSTGAKKNIAIDSLKQVLPIKNILDYKITKKEKLVIIGTVILLIIIIIVIYFLVRKKRNPKLKEIKKSKPKDPAHVIALRKLDELKSQRYLPKGLYKHFAIELSYITREYLENRYLFHAVEMDTYELKQKTKEAFDENILFENLEKIIDTTDLIKFAKYIPLEKELTPLIKQIEILIEQTKKIENNL